ncbi:phospholipase D family protein [Phascolarctobacterium succinatutens]|uniref:phospholipase D family protein n=1 Tax=Phascolarctobacterium succinatutens TaxID=626940 RepID=UPI004028E17D
MRLMIQDPTYSGSMKLGEALIDACKLGVNGAGAYAFAEENGIDLFLGDTDFVKYIKTNKYELIVGTDSITDPKAVARLREYCKLYKNLTVYGYVHDPRKNLFHPKIAWFETNNGGLSIIGSGNLTERGLFHNIEMYSYNMLSSSEIAQVKSDWYNWLDYSISNNFLFDIDDPIIDYAVNLSATKKRRTFVTSETTSNKICETKESNSILNKLYKKQPKATSVKKTINPPIPRTKKIKPKKATSIIETSIPKIAPVDVTPTTNPVWSISPTDRVLVAEVPRASARWKQINFDKASFQNYFGATAGGTGGTYRILLKSVNPEGELGETESRPSVSVASHNWRFEIAAASGLPYPTGDERPYVIFSEASTRSFIYELVMPSDSRYAEVNHLVNAWKKSHNVTGIARFITDVASIKPNTPSLGIWKV